MTHKASDEIYLSRDDSYYMYFPITAPVHGTVHQTLNTCHQHRTAWLPVPWLISLEISNINCWTWRCTLLYFSFGVKNVCVHVYIYGHFKDLKLSSRNENVLS